MDNNTLKDKLMARFGMTESVATRAVNSPNVQRAILVLAEDAGLLPATSIDALKEREEALKGKEEAVRELEINAHNRLSEAIARNNAAEATLRKAEEANNTANELREQTRAMLEKMQALETPGARDKLRLLNIFLGMKGFGPDGKPYNQSYLAACASILSGIPLEQSTIGNGGKQ